MSKLFVFREEIRGEDYENNGLIRCGRLIFDKSTIDAAMRPAIVSADEKRIVQSEAERVREVQIHLVCVIFDREKHWRIRDSWTMMLCNSHRFINGNVEALKTSCRASKASRLSFARL